jgi:zona occludens toxin
MAKPAKAGDPPRPVYYHGITDLKLPWIPFDPQKWRELPPGAIMVVDECQKVFPLRGRGDPEEWIRDLATHRHMGIDFFLITQNPLLFDHFVRRLVDQHFHIVRKFGTHWATIHEYVNGCRDEVAKSRGDSIRHEWRYPKDTFALYKSAELHTVKRRIPMRVWVIGLSIITALVAGYIAVQRLNPANASNRMGAPPTPSAGAGPASPAKAGVPLTAAEFVSLHAPRVPGLAYTAPVYDEVTKPTEAPYPAGCVKSATSCTCYSQQATKLEMPQQLCGDIVSRGFFVAWKLHEQRQDTKPAAAGRQQSDRSTDQPAAAIGIGSAAATRAPVVESPSEGTAPSRPGTLPKPKT